MNIQLFEPPIALRSLVKGYWFSDAEHLKHPSYRIFADGYPGLIFQHQQGRSGLFREQEPLPICFIYGQKTKGFCLNQCAKNTLFFGIQFQPYALKQLLGIDLSLLTDVCLDASELFKDLVLDELFQLNQAHQLLQYFNTYFSTFKTLDFSSSYIIPIAQSFDAFRDRSSRDIAQANQVSTRKFQRDFKAHIGLSFEAYKQMIKFQRAVNQLQKMDPSKLVEMAYVLDYADQAHFGRSFKLYSGYTPKAFLQKPLHYNEREMIHLNRLRILSN